MDPGLDYEWVFAIQVRRLRIGYRALEDGYLGPSPGRKVRALLKAAVQAAVPCMNQESVGCRGCPVSVEKCAFHALFVEDPVRAYLPYFVDVCESEGWNGRVEKGSVLACSVGLIGRSGGFLEDLAAALSRKRLGVFDGAGRERLLWVLEFVKAENRGQPLWLGEIVEQAGSRFPAALPDDPLSVTLDFRTPLSMRVGGRTVTDPGRMDFSSYLEVLYRRLWAASVDHGGYEGHVSDLERLKQTAAGIETLHHPQFRFVRSRAVRKEGDGRRKPEYIGGLKGAVTFVGDLVPFLPLMVAGEALQIGNDTTQGLGRYRILDAAPLGR